jgi:hypothetical protein
VPVQASGSLSMFGSPGQMTAANEGDGCPETSFFGFEPTSAKCETHQWRVTNKEVKPKGRIICCMGGFDITVGRGAIQPPSEGQHRTSVSVRVVSP